MSSKDRWPQVVCSSVVARCGNDNDVWAVYHDCVHTTPVLAVRWKFMVVAVGEKNVMQTP